MKNRIDKLLAKDGASIKSVMKQMGETGDKIIFIVGDDSSLRGTVTDGDIRRWILKDGDLAERAIRVCNRKPTFVRNGYDLDEVKRIMIKRRIEVLPVLDDSGRVVDVLQWGNIFSSDVQPRRSALNLPVLIMAGGKGTRMDPFTRILPKPLIPLGDKPVIERILDSFAEHGCKQFFITLNYKGKMIESYFENAEHRREIKYIWEDEPYGTAGGIKLASPHISGEHLFVSNSDVLVRADYGDIYKFHIKNDSDITIVGSMKHFTVPYGVLNVKNGGSLHGIHEKPEYDYLVNTGLYLMKRRAAKLIPSGTRFDFPELVDRITATGGKVTVYPISQHEWVDVGQWQEYTKVMNLWWEKEQG